MKLLKKNQIIIYTIVLMLMGVAYLNYTTKTQEQSLETSMQIGAKDDSNTSNIGDAKLVSSNDIATSNEINQVGTDNSTDTSNQANNNSTNNNTTNNNTTNTEDTKTTETNAQQENTETIEENSEYFTKSKLERDTMYSQMLETYEKILNSSNSLETQKQSATDEIKKINNTKNSIMICENLIKTKGFENNIIFVNGESISVIVGSDELTKEEVAQIQNIISREMGAKIENIHISNK